MATTKSTPAEAAKQEIEGFDSLPTLNVQHRLFQVWENVPKPNGQELNARITENLLNATSLEAIFDGPIDADDIQGVPFTFNHVDLHDSDFSSGTGAYVVMNVTTDQGEELTVSCGAEHVLLALTAMIGNILDQNPDGSPNWQSSPALFHKKADKSVDWDRPHHFFFERSKKPTANGYYPINLRMSRG